MIEIINGMAVVSGAKGCVLRPGDVAELDPAYEARLVAAGIARSLGGAMAIDGAAPVPESPGAVPETPEIVPETPEIVPGTAEKGGEITENVGKQAEIAPEAPEKDPSKGDSGDVPAVDADTAGAIGIPSHEELVAMKRPELAALAAQWGVECPVGTTNAAIVASLEALASEQAPDFAALGAVE